MIDLHSHILPGLDDGSRTVDDARALARRAAEDGVTAIAATPHVRNDYPTRPEEMERGVARLREDFLEQRIDVEVLPGGEIDLGMLGSLEDDDLRRFSLARSERYLLLEFPYSGWPSGLEETVYGLGLRGFQAVLAHPERNRAVQARPGQAHRGDSAGRARPAHRGVARRAHRPLRPEGVRAAARSGLAHVLASDAHTADVREAGLAAAAEAVGDDRLAAFLTAEAPTAIVAGEAVPGSAAESAAATLSHLLGCNGLRMPDRDRETVLPTWRKPMPEAGPREARFNRLYELHLEAVRGYARGVPRRWPTRSPPRRSSSPGGGSTRCPRTRLPWLLGVARNVRANLRRGDRRRDALVERLGPEAASGGDIAVPLAERDALRAALAGLSETDREILLLAAWDDLDRGEIARALGCTRANVAVRLFRARRRLEAALAAGEHGLPAHISGGVFDARP